MRVPFVVATWVLLVATLPLAPSVGPASAAVGGGGATRVLTMTDPRIHESSSLVASRLHPGVLWTANDSGDESRIFAVGRDGRTLATYRLAVAPARDWEAMTPTVDGRGRPALLVGDIGDNNSVRTKGILLHLVTEPARIDPGADRPLHAVSYRLRYPDGPHDAEGVAVDPRTGQVLVLTKGIFGGGIYAAPRRMDRHHSNLLRRVADDTPLITDAVYLPDGTLAVRDYSDAYLLDASFHQQADLALPEQQQGESLAVSTDGRALLVGSEGKRSAVWRVPLPPHRSPAARRTTTQPGAPGHRPAAAGPTSSPRTPLAVAGIVLAVLAVAGLRHRRRR